MDNALDQSFPNPFNSSTHIGFGMPQVGTVEIAIHNLLGQEVRLLISGIQPGGRSRSHGMADTTAGAPFPRGCISTA